MAPTLKEVEAMVDSLAAADQIRLLEHLVPRVANATLVGEPKPVDADDAWKEFRRVGDRLAAMPGPSITQAISDTRQ